MSALFLSRRAGEHGTCRLLSLLLLLCGAAARWCQIETVKEDVNRDYTFSGPWRIETCTTLELDHGKCDEEDCPYRTKLVDEEIIELADALHGNKALTALSINSNQCARRPAPRRGRAWRPAPLRISPRVARVP